MASRRDTIVTALLAQLNTITVAAGYNSNLAVSAGGGGAVKPDIKANVYENLPLVLLSVPGENRDASDATALYWRCELQVELYAFPEPDETTPIEDLIDDLVEDIERVLLTQGDAEPPLAVTGVERLDVVRHRKFAAEGELMDGAMVEIELDYRHDVTDPRAYTGTP